MSIKTFATFAIIVGCFAVLYPKFLLPMFNRLLGYDEQKAEAKQGDYPPGYSKAMGKKPEQANQQVPDNVMRHIRSGPHPGMRAAADMNRQQVQHGSGRGMMGIVLPMYAVGIVLYLVYTLVKVFNKKEKEQSQDKGQHGSRSGRGENLYENRDGKFTYGDDFSNPESIHRLIQSKQKQQELEDLLVRADDQNITANEMRELQSRLEETEAQMSKILFAMEHVGTKVDNVAADNIPDETEKEDKKTDAKDNHSMKASSDSSPDMESYEIVKNATELKNNSEKENTSKVNISPKTVVESGSEVSTSLEAEVESVSEAATSPETIIPEEIHKRQIAELKTTSENEDDSMKNEQDVLLEEKVADEDENTNVRQRKLPSPSQD